MILSLQTHMLQKEIRTYTYIFTCAYIYIHVYTYITYIYIHVYIYITYIFQEEIRFAICPDLMIGALLCPCMEDREAIQVIYILNIYIQTHIYAYVHIFICMYITHLCPCMEDREAIQVLCICVHIHVYIRMCIYACIII